MKLPGSSDARSDAAVEDLVVDADRVVRCAACGARVARPFDRIERFGAHAHDRVNPAGFAFRIACFAHADGALALGPPSLDFAWFPGCPWQVAVCRACGVHLGWSFGGDAPFWGLSLDAIVDAT